MLNKSGSGLKFSGIKPLTKIAGQAKALAFATPLYDLTLMGGSPDDLHVIPTDPWPGRIDVGQDILMGRYAFAGQMIETDHLVWEPVGASKDWVLELHRFGWLRDLKAVSNDKARLVARHMISDWIDQYDKWHDVAWQPDVLGARLSNWIGMFSFYGLSADEGLQNKVRSSIARQTKHLARVITDGQVDPVQSLSALKGLIYALIAIGSPKKQLEHPFKLVLEQVDCQILPDGGHVSRSPIILARSLMILIDLRNVLNLAKLPVPEQIQHAIDRMVPALKFFRYADGGVGSFNGGYEGNASVLDCILNLSGTRGRPLKQLDQTGYVRLRQGRGMVMVDKGMPLQQEHSRGAHAAPLSFEFAFGRERVITNCGAVSEFGEWHEALRATAAHSTLIVDQRNACQIDQNGRFNTLPKVQSETIHNSDMCLFDGAHTGYIPRYGITHGRRLQLKEAGNILLGEDVISGGGSGVPYTIRFHLHPTSHVSLIQNGTEALIQTKGRNGWRMKVEGAQGLSIEDSIYIGMRQVLRRTQQIVITGQTQAEQTVVNWGLARIHT